MAFKADLLSCANQSFEQFYGSVFHEKIPSGQCLSLGVLAVFLRKQLNELTFQIYPKITW